MIMHDKKEMQLSPEDAREYILDILQDLAQLARTSGERASEDAITKCWQAIWRNDPN